jgi:hypothetical protein
VLTEVVGYWIVGNPEADAVLGIRKSDGPRKLTF